MNKILLILIACFFVINVYSQDKDDDLKKLMSILDIKKMTEEIIGSRVTANIDKEKLEKFIKKSVEINAKLYSKHFTKEEIKELIKFLDTPTGKKMLNKRNIITQEWFELLRDDAMMLINP